MLLAALLGGLSSALLVVFGRVVANSLKLASAVLDRELVYMLLGAGSLGMVDGAAYDCE